MSKAALKASIRHQDASDESVLGFEMGLKPQFVLRPPEKQGGEQTQGDEGGEGSLGRTWSSASHASNATPVMLPWWF